MQSSKLLRKKRCLLFTVRYVNIALVLIYINYVCVYVVASEKMHMNEFYTAGVVEFRPSPRGMSSDEMLTNHLNAYMEIIQSNYAKDIDIIVFPEGTLNNDQQLSYVPSEKQRIIPCLSVSVEREYGEFLMQLSCTARKVKKYLVVNLSEKEDCMANVKDPRPCAANGLNVFNTNVVFDREGRIISRYRKVHVYVENKNTTLQPEFGLFETDFGVTFGHIICFDILFYTPAQQLVDQFNITNIILTSFFYSELPFLTATQLQFGWAWGNNVNLLAAGASYPPGGTTGTGLYAGQRGALISTMVQGEGERRLYKARLRKNPLANNEIDRDLKTIEININFNGNHHLDGIKLLKDPQIHNYNSILLDFNVSLTFHELLCYQDLCCTFDIDVKEIVGNNHYFYRIGVFDGRRSYEKAAWSDITVCALYTCTDENVHSCGESLTGKSAKPNLIVFRKIRIKGTFARSSKMLIMPSTIDYELNPLAGNHIQWLKQETDSSYDIEMNLIKEHNNLMTFGIYAMYYEKSNGNVCFSNNYFGLYLVLLIFIIKISKMFH